MSALTPEDVANVCKLLERLRTGEMNLIPSLATAEPRNPNGKSEAMLQRVEELLSAHLRRMLEPVGDGGPAFPVRFDRDAATGEVLQWQSDGLSTRDYFAAEALQLAHGWELASPTHGGTPGSPTYQGIAERAYLMADAMLKARQS